MLAREAKTRETRPLLFLPKWESTKGTRQCDRQLALNSKYEPLSLMIRAGQICSKKVIKCTSRVGTIPNICSKICNDKHK